MSKRGELTERIQEISKKRIGRKISKEELRLIPYIYNIMLNNQRVNTKKISKEEHNILMKWDDEELIRYHPNGIGMTKRFWDFANEVLWFGYVVRD